MQINESGWQFVQLKFVLQLAVGNWQLCQCTVSVKIFFAVPSRMDAPWDTWVFFVKLLFLSYLKQNVFMPIVHVHDCNCELQEPFTVFMQAWFGQYRRPCRLYMCIPSGNRVPDLLKTNSGAAMVPAYSTFWIRFHVWNSFFCAIRTGIGPVQKAI